MKHILKSVLSEGAKALSLFLSLHLALVPVLVPLVPARAQSIIGGTPGGITSRVLYANAGANLWAVKNQASAGTTIVVGPGTYTTAMGATNLLKNGVNWLFLPGSVITNYADGAINYVAAPFDNSPTGTPGAMKCKIEGDLTVVHRGGVLDEAFPRGILTVADPGSEIDFECNEMLLSAESPIMNCVLVSDCRRTTVRVKHRMDAAFGPTELGNPSLANCMWWQAGTFYSKCPLVFTGGRPAFYADGTAAGNWYADHDWIYCTNATDIVWINSNNEAKLWLRFQEMVGNTFGGFAQNIQQLGGKIYLIDFGKIGTFGTSRDAMIVQTGGYLWMRGEKVTTTNRSPFMCQSAGFSDMQVLEWQDNGPGENLRAWNWGMLGGTNHLHGGRAVLNWGPGYYVTNLANARANINGMTISTRGAAQSTNAPIWVQAGVAGVTNVFVSSSLLLSPWEQGANSILASSAGTSVLLGGTTVSALTNAHANITIAAGTLTTDVDYKWVLP